MANTYLTIDMISREALRLLHEKVTFIGTINRGYDKSFANKGAQIGDTLRIRKPARYTVRSGKVMQARNSQEEYTNFAISSQRGVDMDGFSSADMALKIDDFTRQYVDPAMAVLASYIDNDALQGLTKQVWNLVGTPGTTPNTMLTFGEARAKLNQNLAPKVMKERMIQLESIAMATMSNANKTLFSPESMIGKQYLEGMISQHSGFNWYENERIYVHTNGDDVAGAVDEPSGTNLVEGTSTIHMDALGTTVTVGSVFTIADVKAVHPETKVAYQHDQQFVVTAVGSIAGNEGDITFAPAIYTSSSYGKQNVDHMPSDGDVVTFIGSANGVYEQHLAYHKNFATFGTADLPLPKGAVEMCKRINYDGIAMRMIQDYDGKNDDFFCRLDVLYGYAGLYLEHACRITG